MAEAFVQADDLKPRLIVGGVIPSEDFKTLEDMGIAAIFTPGTVIPEAAITVLERLNERLGYAQ
jgi:methylmalonyl-CoA mutase